MLTMTLSGCGFAGADASSSSDDSDLARPLGPQTWTQTKRSLTSVQSVKLTSISGRAGLPNKEARASLGRHPGLGATHVTVKSQKQQNGRAQPFSRPH